MEFVEFETTPADYTEPIESYHILDLIETNGGKENKHSKPEVENNNAKQDANSEVKNIFGHQLSRNNTSFTNKLTTKLHMLHEEYIRLKNSGSGEGFYAALKYHQWLVVEWMSSYEYVVKEARGLLCNHDMGTGKTRIGAATMLALMEIGIYPIFIAPKSLQNNMMSTVREILLMTRPGITDAEIIAIQRKFTVASSDAYNLFAQVTKHGSTFDNRIIVIDEAHDFFRAIVNSGNDETNSRKLYNAIMSAKNCRLLFLTGSPIVKNVFEMVPMCNMLAGSEILPIQYDLFMEMYVDLPNRKLKNRDKLQNRLFGLVSRVSTELPLEPNLDSSKMPKPRDIGHFPELLPMKIIRVEMSERQYKAYLLAREKEELELTGRGKFSERTGKGSALSLPSSDMGRGMSTYYVKSRMISNFCPPDEYVGKPFATIPDTAFVVENGPKLAMIAKLIKENPGSAAGYSQFVDYGLGALGRFLKNEGYTEFKAHIVAKHNVAKHIVKTPKPDKKEATSLLNQHVGKVPTDIRPEVSFDKEAELDEELEQIREDVKVGGAAAQYALLSGRVDPKDRTKMQQEFNNPENKNGDLIKFLGFSATGAQGLDLHCGRYFYGIESYWSNTRIDQAITRIRRLGSHDLLPRELRQVQPYMFLSVANRKIYDGIPDTIHKEKESIDERFWRKSLEQGMIIEDARKLLQEVSIECIINGYPNCARCAPTNKPLYHDDARMDLKLPNPCEENKESEVEAKPIILGDETYYYSKRKKVIGQPDDVEFYQFDDELGAYFVIPSDDPIVDQLTKILPN